MEWKINSNYWMSIIAFDTPPLVKQNELAEFNGFCFHTAVVYLEYISKWNWYGIVESRNHACEIGTFQSTIECIRAAEKSAAQLQRLIRGKVLQNHWNYSNNRPEISTLGEVAFRVLRTTWTAAITESLFRMLIAPRALCAAKHFTHESSHRAHVRCKF